MGFIRGFEKATGIDTTGRTVDAHDLRGALDTARPAQREVLAIQQRDELIRLQRETNDLLRELISRRP